MLVRFDVAEHQKLEDIPFLVFGPCHTKPVQCKIDAVQLVNRE
jgi:hypothetical protein